MDDDSLLLKSVEYDVFRFMRERELQYGYIAQTHDSKDCITGLWEASEKYINETHLHPRFFSEWKKEMMYYNNFEITSTKLWLSEDYKKYIDYIDQLGGIYYHRWGDAPIHSIAVAIFLNNNQTHKFADIGYMHLPYKINAP
jgi:hypothetical protein